MHRRLIVIVGLALAPAALAIPTLFAVDAPTETLVRVNPSTGVVIEVGPIDLGPGTGVVNDFASQGGRLFVLNSLYPVAAFIGELNPGNAATLSSAQCTVDGSIAINATEGLAVDEDGRLIISLWRPGSPTDSNSDNLGVLALSGEITDIVPMGVGADFDGLGSDPSGSMVGLDRNPGAPNDYVRLLNVSYDPPSFNIITTTPISAALDLVDDCAVLDGVIITMDLNFKRINRHNRATGAIESFTLYPSNYSMYTMAVVDLCAGDVNGSGFVDFADLNTLLGAFNTSQQSGAYDGRADRDTDGDVDFADLNHVLSGFNDPCP